MDGDGNISVSRFNWIFKPSGRLGDVPYFWKHFLMFYINKTNPKKTTKAQIDDNEGDRLGWKLPSELRQVNRWKEGNVIRWTPLIQLYNCTELEETETKLINLFR